MKEDTSLFFFLFFFASTLNRLWFCEKRNSSKEPRNIYDSVAYFLSMSQPLAISQLPTTVSQRRLGCHQSTSELGGGKAGDTVGSIKVLYRL